MTSHDENYAIEAAIQVGDIAYARELVRDAIKAGPTADIWYLAALVASTPQQEAAMLERALAADPYHENALRALEVRSREKTLSHAQSLRTRLQQVLAQRRT